MVKVPDRKTWEISFVDELGKLSQGIRTVKGANTVIFIPKTQVPKDKKCHIWKNSVQSETRNRREGTNQINGGQKLVGLHSESQLSNRISHY